MEMFRQISAKAIVEDVPDSHDVLAEEGDPVANLATGLVGSACPALAGMDGAK